LTQSGETISISGSYHVHESLVLHVQSAEIYKRIRTSFHSRLLLWGPETPKLCNIWYWKLMAEGSLYNTLGNFKEKFQPMIFVLSIFWYFDDQWTELLQIYTHVTMWVVRNNWQALIWKLIIIIMLWCKIYRKFSKIYRWAFTPLININFAYACELFCNYSGYFLHSTFGNDIPFLYQLGIRFLQFYANAKCPALSMTDRSLNASHRFTEKMVLNRPFSNFMFQNITLWMIYLRLKVSFEESIDIEPKVWQHILKCHPII